MLEILNAIKDYFVNNWNAFSAINNLFWISFIILFGINIISAIIISMKEQVQKKIGYFARVIFNSIAYSISIVSMIYLLYRYNNPYIIITVAGLGNIFGMFIGYFLNKLAETKSYKLTVYVDKDLIRARGFASSAMQLDLKCIILQTAGGGYFPVEILAKNKKLYKKALKLIRESGYEFTVSKFNSQK